MISFFLLLNLCLGLTPQVVDPCGCEDKPQVNILAVVNGVKITKQQLGSDAQNKISLLQDEVIKARNAELDLLINRLLLDAEAKRRGISSEQLLQLEVAAKVSEPTEAEARVFYNEQKERMPDDFKAVKAQIISFVRSERQRFQAMRFANGLRAAANLTILDQNVTPPASEEGLNRIFARLNGRNITSRDIEDGLAPLIFRVQKQVYEIRKQDLELRINDMLLEQEAKRQNSTPEAILNRAVRAKLPIITDQQAKAFYDENKAQFPQDFEKVKLQIVHFLTQKEEEKLSNAFAAQLRQNAAVQIYLTPPESRKR